MLFIKRVTLKELAAMANVSVSAVSLILNNKPARISKEKIEEVKRIARELNYRPNHLAASLSGRATRTIGILIPDISNPFFAEIVKALDYRLREKGYYTIIANGGNIESEKYHINQFIERQVDGLLLCISNDGFNHLEEIVQHVNWIDRPTIIIDRFLPGCNKLQICFDNIAGGKIATEYLIKKGCTRLACLTGDVSTYTSQQRLEGFQQALREHGLPLEEMLIFNGDYSAQSGYKIGSEQPSLWEAEGIFCFNDMMTFGLKKAFFERYKNRKLPLIVGYDNLKINEFLPAPIPSIEQDVQELVTKACEMLFGLLNGEKVDQPELLQPKFKCKK
ncbi:MAG: LacI family DNA-binding transcriptional regulator [Aerococcaceae bacterium]|nr:LacI family DNA-binding transcriptional regulator [Aerococcaceae bacterium]